jgi:hypothetical protein
MPDDEPQSTQRNWHHCPIDGCNRRVLDHRLMCGPHWRGVPADLQRRLYRAWKHGRGAGTDAHAAAMAACIHAADLQVRP